MATCACAPIRTAAWRASSAVSYLKRNLETRHPRSVRLCALLDKIERRDVDVAIDYLGFTIPNLFVVGYGLDAGGLHRNLPYIAVLDGMPSS